MSPELDKPDIGRKVADVQFETTGGSLKPSDFEGRKLVKNPGASASA
ncbi:MAG: hypothetical protein ABIP08_05240 [Lautropia sp.]